MRPGHRRPPRATETGLRMEPFTAIILFGRSLNMVIPGQVRTCPQCPFGDVSEEKGITSKNDQVGSKACFIVCHFSVFSLPFS